MRFKASLFIGFLVSLIGTNCQTNESKSNISNASFVENNDSSNAKDGIPGGLIKIKAAYSDFIFDIQPNKIIWIDSTEIIYDDGREKDFVQLLNEADIEDQLFFPYPDSFPSASPKYLEDPGRIRNKHFFAKIYGASKAEVEKNLEEIPWLPSHTKIKLKFNKQNGASKALKAVSNAFEQKPHLIKYLDEPAGTFNWRKIAGTNRYSMHSYGIAIDINVSFSNYWKWSNPNASEMDSLQYENKIPQEIVEVFESHGFIWGGKWYHFDTMHFEYRPEFFIH